MDLSPLQSRIEDGAVRDAVQRVYDAGVKILAPQFRTGPQGGLEKGDPNVGHHAIVTRGDYESQRMLLAATANAFPQARVITEEKEERYPELILHENELDSLFSLPLVFGDDPVDSTVQYHNSLYEWCVSRGVMRTGTHIGGAIFAPEIRGGLLVAGDRSSGVAFLDGNKGPQNASITDRLLENSMVYLGIDLVFLPQYSAFSLACGKRARCVKSVGSCALGLALVACGKVDAVVQPVQCPWDWFAGFPLIEAAGGMMIFYHYRNGRVMRLEKPDTISYSTEKRNVAFVAGAPRLAEELFALLQKTWGQ